MKKNYWGFIRCGFLSIWLFTMAFLKYGHIANEEIGNIFSINKSGFALQQFYTIWILMLLVFLINIIFPIFNQWKDKSNEKNYKRRNIKCFVWTMFFIILIFALMYQINTVYCLSINIFYLISFFSAPLFLLLCIKLDPILFEKFSNKETKIEDEKEFTKKEYRALKIFATVLLIVLLPVYVITNFPVFPNSYIYFSNEYATVYGSYFGVSYADKMRNKSELYNGGMSIDLSELIRWQFGEFSLEAYGFNDFNMYGSTSLELGKSHTYVYYSDNYNYYIEQIKKLNKEREELLYENEKDYESTDDLKKDIEKLEELSQRIQKLEDNIKTMDYQYIKVTYHVEKLKYVDVKILDEVIYDTQRNDDNEDSIKWGKKKNWLFYSIAKENIILSENEFEKNTDFTQTKIGVKIFYNDGSMKLTYITPSNASELNNVKPGDYKIYWTDSWGSYEKEIKII